MKIHYILLLNVYYVCSHIYKYFCLTLINTLNYRKENKEFLEAVFDESSKQKRCRKNAINLQITATSWCLELISNVIVLVWWFLAIEHRSTIIILLWIDGIMCFIIIPASYISNTEVVKSNLPSSRWYMTFVNIFRSNKIHPVAIERIQMNHLPNEEFQDMSVHKPIRTISGNIESLS